MEEPEKSAVPDSMEMIKSKDKSPKVIYFELLRAWVNHANMSQNISASFPYYLLNNYPQLFQINSSTPQVGNAVNSFSNQQTNQTANQNNTRRANELLDPARQEEIINQNGGYEYVIPPLWKRFVAEIIDIAIIFILKLITTFAIVDAFDIDLNIDLDFEAIKNSLEDDYTELLSFTSELIFLEIITKIVVCIYETLWTAQGGQAQAGGATPGKMLMGIRILHVDAVILLDPQPPGLNNNAVPIKALLFPATNPGFKRALLRAIAKNALIALFFPMCFLMFFFKHNRTIYDIMTKTIVVEDNPAPVLRRR